MLQVHSKCPDPTCPGTTWQSQPWLGNKPAGNVLLAATILFSGCPVAASLRALQSIKVQTITERTHFNYQRGYLLPAVNKVKNCGMLRLHSITANYCPHCAQTHLADRHVSALSTLRLGYHRQKTTRSGLSTSLCLKHKCGCFIFLHQKRKMIRKHQGHVFLQNHCIQQVIRTCYYLQFIFNALLLFHRHSNFAQFYSRTVDSEYYVAINNSWKTEKKNKHRETKIRRNSVGGRYTKSAWVWYRLFSMHTLFLALLTKLGFSFSLTFGVGKREGIRWEYVHMFQEKHSQDVFLFYEFRSACNWNLRRNKSLF